jgi:hypothetical protein
VPPKQWGNQSWTRTYQLCATIIFSLYKRILSAICFSSGKVTNAMWEWSELLHLPLILAPVLLPLLSDLLFSSLCSSLFSIQHKRIFFNKVNQIILLLCSNPLKSLLWPTTPYLIYQLAHCYLSVHISYYSYISHATLHVIPWAVLVHSYLRHFVLAVLPPTWNVLLVDIYLGSTFFFRCLLRSPHLVEVLMVYPIWWKLLPNILYPSSLFFFSAYH